MAHNNTILPSFFKPLVAEHFKTQLQIPQYFVKTFTELFMSNKFCLHTHSAYHSWEVEVENFNERTYFTKGWEEFVKDNLLEFKDLIVFEYVAPSSFKVKMHGPHGCGKRVEAEKEKESPKILKKNKRKTVEEEEEEEEVMKKRMKHQKARTSIHQNENDDSKDHVKRSISLAQEEARRFKSNHPFFKVDLHPSSYVNSFMYLPTKFYKTYLKGKVGKVNLEVSGRVWSVGIISVNRNRNSKCNSARLSRGWRAFFEENKLKAGDVCIFEIKKKKKRSNFQVHIFRC